jgi:hypothetical protein
MVAAREPLILGRQRSPIVCGGAWVGKAAGHEEAGTFILVPFVEAVAVWIDQRIRTTKAPVPQYVQHCKFPTFRLFRECVTRLSSTTHTEAHALIATFDHFPE